MLRGVQTADDRARPDRAAPRVRSTRTWRPTTRCSTRRATRGADLVVFPELGLTGYQLQDLASRGRDAARRPAPGRARRGDPRACRRSSRSSRSRPTTGCSSRPPCSRTARSGTSTARSSCRPTACSTSAGSSPPATCCGRCRRAWGSGIGIGICEDFWHLPVPQLLALDGAQILINVSSSPGRDLAATNEVGLGTATSWRTLMRTYAQLTTSFVDLLQPGRGGRVDLVLGRLGGHRPDRPGGLQRAALRRGPVHGRRSRPADIRRERIALPLLRDERPELNVRELQRIVAERAGLAGRLDRRPGAEAGLDVAPAEPPAGADRVRTHGERAVRPAWTGAHDRGRSERRAPPFELPAELAIDTDVARRVIAEFIRGQLEQAGFERAVLGLSGGIDSALVAYLVAEAIGADGCSRDDAVPDSSPASRADAERSSPRSAAPASWSRSRPWSTATSGPASDRRGGPDGLDASRCGAATSPPGCGWRCCTTGR